MIVDAKKRVIGVLAGKPVKDGSTEEWDRVASEAGAAIAEARERLRFKPKDLSHRRGEFPAKAFGMLDGLGHKVRCTYCGRMPELTISKKVPKSASLDNPENKQIIDDLRKHPAILRLAGFGSSKWVGSLLPHITNDTTQAVFHIMHRSSMPNTPKSWRILKA